jgi:hypothetical protein
MPMFAPRGHQVAQKAQEESPAGYPAGLLVREQLSRATKCLTYMPCLLNT